MNKPDGCKGMLLENEPLARYTSWRVGGPARCLYIPEDRQDLLLFLAGLPHGEQLFWLGLGSNLLVRDGGIDATVISTRNRLKDMQQLDNEHVYVEAGVPCALVARFCSEREMGGAEFLAGIPGTMGGALKMNAGAFGGETWNIVSQVETVNARGDVMRRDPAEFTVTYRSVSGPAGEWFLAARLKLRQGCGGDSQRQIKALLEKRNATQPTSKPTCGSVFKNPPGDYAARLIEVCGLKGYRIGDAVVSEKHANFIENCGNATAKDIEMLIDSIQDKVEAQCGVRLQTEVCRVGVRT